MFPSQAPDARASGTQEIRKHRPMLALPSWSPGVGGRLVVQTSLTLTGPSTGAEVG